MKAREITVGLDVGTTKASVVVAEVDGDDGGGGFEINRDRAVIGMQASGKKRGEQ